MKITKPKESIVKPPIDEFHIPLQFWLDKYPPLYLDISIPKSELILPLNFMLMQ